MHRGLAFRSLLPMLLVLTFVSGISSNASAQVTLLSDDFNGASLDTSKWSVSVFTGFQDTSIPVTQTSGQLRIGPLLQGTAASGSHFNGITSVNRFDFTGAFAYVQLVQPAASNTTAFTMFAVGNDSNNFYRFYVSGTSLVCEQKIAGTKTSLATITYNSVAHQFLRIRHDSAAGNVIYETAPNNNGVPGPWLQQFTGTWNTTAVPVTSVLFEMKAGTSFTETNPPGTVIFDNFKAAVLIVQ
ncbi:MAG: hypothetical protein DMG65_17710 [Candidatus Angelobacter sp. Gp1-AA117]|nr:MAG: hypothetical protein DMG65_17710 [Candidatus Angelobacter sp. Gp1-AA117]